MCDLTAADGYFGGGVGEFAAVVEKLHERHFILQALHVEHTVGPAVDMDIQPVRFFVVSQAIAFAFLKFCRSLTAAVDGAGVVAHPVGVLSIANFVGTTPKIGSMGRPCPLYDVVVLDPDGNECKTGDTGEICIRTAEGAPNGLFIGYYLDEEKTNEVWHDGYYHTGDTATMDEDGYLWYVGRIDDVIKSSGYRTRTFLGPAENEDKDFRNSQVTVEKVGREPLS